MVPEFWFGALRSYAIAPSSARRALTLEDSALGILSKITSTPVAAIEAGLKQAIEENVIARHFSDRLQDWLERYRELSVHEALKDGSQSNLRDLLAASGVLPEKQDAFVQAYLQGGSRDDIVQRIRADQRFTETEAAAIHTTLLLNDLTLGDGNLVKELKQQFDDPSRVRDLAKMPAQDWEAAIARANANPPDFVAGDNPEDKRRAYALLLSNRLAMEYPTAAFSGGLARAIASQQKPALENAGQILKFFDEHPDFELASMSIDGYLKAHTQPEFFNAVNKEAFVRDLKAAQRVFKLVPNFEASNTLLNESLHSGHSIYSVGESRFVTRFGGRPGFSERIARDTYQRAANTHAAALTIIGELRATVNANAVAGLKNEVDALAEIPNLATLFGSADLCDCEHCRSIFGPAAYLADVLMYLKARESTAPAVSAKDVLFRRRPDIGDLELSCENSNVPVPYIDLACEVLEDHVAPWKRLSLTFESSFVTGPVSDNLRDAFAATEPIITLTVGATIDPKDKMGSWVVRDGGARYRVVKTSIAFVVSPQRQTRGTAEELAAYPAYINKAAYDVLREAKRPLALPFDLPTEEVRAYLDRVSIRRSDLMEVFRGPLDPNKPSDLDIAAEYLGIAKHEQVLFFKPDPTNQFVYWNEIDLPHLPAELAPPAQEAVDTVQRRPIENLKPLLARVARCVEVLYRDRGARVHEFSRQQALKVRVGEARAIQEHIHLAHR